MLAKNRMSLIFSKGGYMQNLGKDDVGVLKSLEMLDIILIGYFSQNRSNRYCKSLGKLIDSTIKINSLENTKNHFMIIDPANLKSISCAVAMYLLFDQFKRLVYIGSSHNVKKRLSGHDKLKKSDSYFIVIPMDHLQVFPDWRNRLNLIEKGLICILQPERNELGYIRGKNRR